MSSSSNKGSTAAASFGFRELAEATRGFKEVNLLGEGGFGRVYKGRLATGEVNFYLFIQIVLSLSLSLFFKNVIWIFLICCCCCW